MQVSSSKGSFAAAFILAILMGGWTAWKFSPSAIKSSSPQWMYSAEKELMGTRWMIQVAMTNRMNEKTLQEHIDSAFEEVARVESIMSEWQEESPISAVNAAAGHDPVTVPDELRDLILRSKEISELSQGAFDITWKGIADLWQLRDDAFAPPSDHLVRQALDRVNYRKIKVNQNTVGLETTGMQIGLGGIAKGYGVDQAAKVLRAAGLNHFYIDGGGDIAVAGLKHGRPWRVAIRHPRKKPTELLTVVELSDAAIVTSGDYENYRIFNDQRFHHILDPRTGKPAQGCQSVTVTAPLTELADALATAAFVLGPEQGLKLILQYPNTDALIVDANGRFHMTDLFKTMDDLRQSPAP
jgi:thiamine biosynthesis lipoprotein